MELLFLLAVMWDSLLTESTETLNIFPTLRSSTLTDFCRRTVKGDIPTLTYPSAQGLETALVILKVKIIRNEIIDNNIFFTRSKVCADGGKSCRFYIFAQIQSRGCL